MAGTVHSAGTALDVLECFADEEELGVTEVALRLGVSKSTAHRALTTLVSRGLVSRSAETSRYRLGMRLYELGQLAMTRNQLRRMALPTLVQLRQTSGLTVQLAIPDGADVVYAERLETNLGIALLRRTGRRLPAHTTSSGKAIAAFNPSFAEARRAAGFPARTEFTLTTAEEWEATLAEVRRQHGAISYDEATVGVGTCAAPLHGPSGEAIASVSLVGSTEAFRAQGGHFLSLVTVAAAKLSRAALP